jgi:hypothetical protein
MPFDDAKPILRRFGFSDLATDEWSRMVVILCAFTVRSDKQQSSTAAERSVIEFKSLLLRK